MKFQILCPQTPLQLPFLANLLHIKRLNNSRYQYLQVLEISAALQLFPSVFLLLLR